MKVTDDTILNFIGGRKKVCVVPSFQRNYVWNEKQCKELYDDIKNATKNNINHYIGTNVYYMGKNTSSSVSELALVNGQQRITTVLILLCALRNTMSQFFLGLFIHILVPMITLSKIIKRKNNQMNKYKTIKN